DGSVMTVERPHLGPIDFGSQRTYYYLCLAVLAVAAFSVARLRRSGIGRALVGVRDNEANAAAYTVSPARAKLGAFAVSGGLAALAGGLLAGLNVNFGVNFFAIDESVRVVA